MPFYPDADDSRRRDAENQTFRELRAEYFQDFRTTFFAMRAYQELNEALDLIENAHEKIGRRDFLTQCDQIHTYVEFHLKSNAITLSDISNGGVYTRHKLLRLEEGYRDPKTINFDMNMSEGRHLWNFKYINFYKALFEDRYPYERFTHNGKIDPDTLNQIIRDHDLLFHEESGMRISLEDYLQDPRYRTIGDPNYLAATYEEIIGVSDKASISDEEFQSLITQKHGERQERAEYYLDVLTESRLRTIENGLHHVDVGLYEVEGLYRNCENRNLLDKPDIEKKVAIAFVMSHRYSRTESYKSAYDLPFDTILKYAERVGQITMPKKDMSIEELVQAEFREEFSAYLQRVLLKHKSFLENFMRN